MWFVLQKLKNRNTDLIIKVTSITYPQIAEIDVFQFQLLRGILGSTCTKNLVGQFYGTLNKMDQSYAKVDVGREQSFSEKAKDTHQWVRNAHCC